MSSPWPGSESSIAKTVGTCYECGGAIYENLVHTCGTFRVPPTHCVPPGDAPKVEPTIRYFTELRASLKNALDVQMDLGRFVAQVVGQRDRLAQALRLLRVTSSEDSYVYNVAVAALTEAGIPDLPEEDHL